MGYTPVIQSNLLSIRAAAVCLLVTVVGFATLGCESTPKGETGGRIDPYRTTRSDQRSSRASIPAMLEFGDTVSASLAQEISELDAVASADGKLVLELGSIENHTGTPTTDFEQLRNRIRGQLFRSKLVKEHFLIVESRQRMQKERDRVVGDGEGDPPVARYDPAITYVLQGDFYESNRGSRRQYYMEFKLTNLASREIVFQESFDLGQQ